MAGLSVPAHFDGIHILLDEPIELKPNAKLVVTILSEQDEERESWQALANQGLASAYGQDEPEYSLDLIKEPNPNYEAG